jgi:hypothetical protein
VEPAQLRRHQGYSRTAGQGLAAGHCPLQQVSFSFWILFFFAGFIIFIYFLILVILFFIYI